MPQNIEDVKTILASIMPSLDWLEQNQNHNPEQMERARRVMQRGLNILARLLSAEQQS